MDKKNFIVLVLSTIISLSSCACSQESASNPSNTDLNPSGIQQSSSDSAKDIDLEYLSSKKGALVTADCKFEDYSYAIDILLSCGSEELGDALRLHTFKKHAHDHRKVFNDQLLTYRDGRLWFDAYDPPLCVKTNNDQQLGLSDQTQACSMFDLIEDGHTFIIQNRNSGFCAGLGGSSCESHRPTGGYECGGISHRYLPLVFGDCDNALRFTWKEQADICTNEYPRNACFSF